MRAAQCLRFVPLALLVIGCSDPTGPDPSPSDSPILDPVPDVTLSIRPAYAEVRVGESIRLAATITRGVAFLTPESSIAWFSSNDEAATVSATGVVEGLRAGTTVIWATYGGTRAAAHVRVFGPGKKADNPPRN
jgi:uncharacterized protein YjdB